MNQSSQPIQIRFHATVFTADELARLAAYGAAIAAGFYTDNCPDTADVPTTLMGLATQTVGAGDNAS